MLYIFHVDSGTMMTFEMNLALESVGQLKDVIEKTRRIPVEKQVLLVSGGECLDPSSKVCSYSAGTDTNPIFLFSKCTLENAKPPSPSIDYGSDSDMKDLVDNSLIMPATYNTIVKRAQIAQQFCELAREHTMVCESLVHDQHLQQQGWAAAVANLEDITAAFKTKSEMFEQNYRQYLESRGDNLKILHNFSDDLQTLAKIPILDPLIRNALSFSTVETKNKSGEQEKAKMGEEESGNRSCEELGSMTLLMWISTADNQSSLEQVAEQAQRGLEQFDEKILEALNREVEATLETANKSEMKEIKGLEERLFGLEQLMVETKKIVQEQTDLAQALLQNQTRAGSLNDPSVLPDLCASHRKQLLVMLHNQNMLRDIRRRCSKAKEELSINLYHRLGWVMYVENLILDVSNKLMIYHENLKRLRKYLEITKQVQRTPQVYVAAVSEVVRRRTFSQAFLTWASDLSCRLLAVYNEEYEKRKDFQSQFEGHFLQSLFPGFEDNPPPFATQAPAPFDVSLPKLTVRDIEQLKMHLPELPMTLSVTKLSHIAQMFLTKSLTEGEPSSAKENDQIEDQLVVAISEASLGSGLDKTLLHPTQEQEGERRKLFLHKDDRDFESETDTEEFEKVCQSPVEVKAAAEPKFEKENSCAAKNEVQTLRNHLSEAGKLANATAIYLKTELIEMKSQSLTDKETILALVKDIQAHISHLRQRYTEEVEVWHKKLEEVSQSRDSEVDALKKVIEGKDEHLSVLADDVNKIKNILEETENFKEELSARLGKSDLRCRELEAELEKVGEEKRKALQGLTDEFSMKLSAYDEQMKSVQKERDKVIAEEREKLVKDHNAKIEEFKSALMRIELDSEMEKEKRMTELQETFKLEVNKQLEALKKKMTEEAEAEKEKAVKEVAEKLSLEYKTEMENLRSRFRLMSAASMDKSPSDSSLEKIERLDKIELAHHEAIVAELKETSESEKAKAVQEALEVEREKLKLKLERELKLGKTRMEEEKQIWLTEAVNRAVAEKNSQIEMLLSRQQSLMTECQNHRDTIRLLMDGNQGRSASCPGAGYVDPPVEKIEVLEKEKVVLPSELDRRKPRRVTEIRHVDDMSASVAVVPVTEVLCRDATTSPEPSCRSNSSTRESEVLYRDAATGSETSSRSDSSSRGNLSRSSLAQGRISITSCGIGDSVLVVWDVEHANYTILQETPTLYFLHSDCLDSLGLRPSSDGSPRRLYCTAEVVEKEYCHAKKSENRYRVPKGTKFYRVKVRPIAHVRESMSRSCHQSRGGEMSASQRSADMSRSHARHSSESSVTSSQLSQSSGGGVDGRSGVGGGEEEDLNVR